MKHNEIIQQIKSRLEKFCLSIECSQEYRLNNGIKGEYDIKAINNDDIIIVEVKSRDNYCNRNKAIKQLYKDYLYCVEKESNKEIKLFYAYTIKNNKRGYVIERITNNKNNTASIK